MDTFHLCQPARQELVPTNNFVAAGGGNDGGSTTNIPFEVSSSFTGGSDDGEAVWTYAATQKFTIPANFVNSRAAVDPDTFNGSFRIMLNGVQIGTVSFVNGVESFTGAGGTVVPDDELQLVANSAYDFTSMSISLRGVRA